MVSRPWIVDSAPELRLTVPSSAMPSMVTPVAGSYAGVPAALAPKNQPAVMPASWPAPSPARDTVGHRDQVLHAGVDAVRDLGAVGARGHASVVRAARGEQPGHERERVAQRRPAQVAVPRDVGRGLEGARASATPRRARCCATRLVDRTAPKGQCRALPPASSAMPSLSRTIVRRDAVVTAGAGVGGEAEHGLGRRVGTVVDQPGRGLPAVDVVVVAVGVERPDGRRRARRAAAGPSGTARTPGRRRRKSA